MKSTYDIAIISNDWPFCRNVRDRLNSSVLCCRFFNNLAEFTSTPGNERFPIVIFDFAAATRDCFSDLVHLRWIMTRKTSIIALTSRPEELELLKSIAAGATDYVIKSHETDFLRGRIHEVLTRMEQFKRSDYERLSFGDYRFDPDTCTISSPEGVEQLSPERFSVSLFAFRNIALSNTKLGERLGFYRRRTKASDTSRARSVAGTNRDSQGVEIGARDHDTRPGVSRSAHN